MCCICNRDFEEKVGLNLDISVPENEENIVVQYLSMLLKNPIPPTQAMALIEIDY